MFEQISGSEILCTDKQDEFVNATDVIKVNYSSENLPGVSVYSSGFLFEKISEKEYIEPSFVSIKGNWVLFPDEKKEEFDLFSMVFWLLSRREEYRSYKADKFGRFPAAESLLYREKVLNLPVLDIAINSFLKNLGLSPQHKFETVPTIDVDIALARGARTWWRETGSFLRKVLQNPLKILISAGSEINTDNDPNNSYDYIVSELSAFPAARIFWHCGLKYSALDKQVQLEKKHVRDIILKVSEKLTPGLHPSAAAFRNSDELQKELNRLQSLAGKTIAFSRQHYILLRFPETYRALISAGITDDYSMGYPDATGFRAGTARAFYWYDIQNDIKTNLKVHPFCIMEVTCKNYLGMGTKAAAEEGIRLKQQIMQTGGEFSFIFHNESLGSDAQWNGWKEVFEAWLK